MIRIKLLYMSGDMLIVDRYNNKIYKEVVKFDEERGGYYPLAHGDGCGCCENFTYRAEYTEVIGNVWDNPDLLGE